MDIHNGDDSFDEDPTGIVEVISKYRRSIRPPTQLHQQQHKQNNSLYNNESLSTINQSRRSSQDSQSFPSSKRIKLEESLLEKENKCNVTEYQQTINVLKKQLDQANIRLSTAEHEKIQSERRVTSLNVEMSKRDGEIQNLKMVHLTNSRSDKEEIERMNGLIDRLKNEMEDSDDSYSKTFDALRRDEKDNRREITTLRQNNSELVTKNVELEHKLQEMYEKYNKLMASKLKGDSFGDHQQNNSQYQQFERQQKRLISDLEGISAKLVDSQTRLVEVENERDKLRLELNSFEESVIEMKSMKDQLNKADNLFLANKKLNEKIEFLQNNAQDVNVLKFKLRESEDERKHWEDVANLNVKSREELVYARKEIEKWIDVATRFVINKEDHHTDEMKHVSPSNLMKSIGLWQSQQIQSKMKINGFESEIKKLKLENEELMEKKNKYHTQYDSLKKSSIEQSTLIKHFQRKLILVTKERENLKKIIESYEKEYDQDLASVQKSNGGKVALKKVETAKQDEIEKIDDQITNNSFNDVHAKLVEAENDIRLLNEELSKFKGHDSNTTRVLHLVNNPTDLALRERRNEVGKLNQENRSLKARVQLLEEGQTANLTLMVGQKVSDDVDPEQIKKLNEKIASLEKMKIRLIEAFKKKSQEFREVCCVLTGYRVDALDHGRYKLYPIYAENGENDYLMFSCTQENEEESECNLIETQFALRFPHLINLHLSEQNSIPVFLAALTIELFSTNQSFNGSQCQTIVTTQSSSSNSITNSSNQEKHDEIHIVE